MLPIPPIVARELERRWNEALLVVRRIDHEIAARLMPDRQIARLLNRAGNPTGHGNGLDAGAIVLVRSHRSVAVHREHEWAERGEITASRSRVRSH